MLTDKKIKQKIVIVGGGTAGWIAANLMIKHWGPLGAEICLIESSEISSIGVGEGSTPQMKCFFDEIGIDESKWMPACNATYKNGIQFVDWSAKNGYKSYFHPFASKIDAFTAPVFLHNCRQRLAGDNLPAHPDRFYLAAYLAKIQYAPVTSENFPFEIGYGYHFDALLLAQFLKKLAMERGVSHIDAKVEQVRQHNSNHIREVGLQDGRWIEGDFFIDCTGFSALLIEKTLAVPFISYKENLFNDRAVAIASPVNSPINSQTISTAMNYGWAWDIPLHNRTGNGYVYSADFCTPDQAEIELRQKLGPGTDNVEARHLNMRVGRREKHWSHNVLAVGLSQGFIEPLEATALHFVFETINSFIRDYGSADFRCTLQSEFNQRLNARFEGIRDYIVGHYRLNSRTDTDYWNENGNNTNLSANLVNIINCWTSGGDLTAEIEKGKLNSYYPPFSWHCMLAGYGVFPPENRLRHLDQSDHKYALDEVDDFIRRSALNFQPHDKKLSKLPLLKRGLDD